MSNETYLVCNKAITDFTVSATCLWAHNLITDEQYYNIIETAKQATKILQQTNTN
jgi:uncharacterized protein (DUF1778 family)